MKSIPRWQRLLTLMQHGGWVSMRDMVKDASGETVAGYRYSARLWELKKKGWDHEYRARGESGELEYRLFRRAPVGMQLSMNLSLTQEAQT